MPFYAPASTPRCDYQRPIVAIDNNKIIIKYPEDVNLSLPYCDQHLTPLGVDPICRSNDVIETVWSARQGVKQAV